MTPKFQEIYEGMLSTISEARTKGSKGGNKTILVMFDKSSPVKTASGIKPMLEEMKKAYFSYLKTNYTEEHGEDDVKKFEPMFKADAMNKTWSELVTVGKTHSEKDEGGGDVFVVELKLNAIPNTFVNDKIIRDKYFKYSWPTAAIEDLLIGSSYKGVLDPKDNPLVTANEALKKKYKFTADVLGKADAYTGQQARKEKKQKFLRQ